MLKNLIEGELNSITWRELFLREGPLISHFRNDDRLEKKSWGSER